MNVLRRLKSSLFPLKPRVLSLVAALLAFLFTIIFFGGTPLDFNGDFFRFYEDTRGPYTEMILLTANPLTAAWIYSAPGVSRYNRPMRYLLTKVFYSNFGATSTFEIQVAMAAGHAVLVAILCAVAYLFTRSQVLSLFIVLFYVTLPSNYYLMCSTFPTDFQYFRSILAVVAVITFGLLTFGKAKTKSSFVLGVLVWVVTIWLGIKLKSSEKILPPICAMFLVVYSRAILPRIGKTRFIVLVLCLLAMTILIVPIRPFEQWVEGKSFSLETLTLKPTSYHDKLVFHFKTENIWKRTFDIGGGESPFTTVLRREFPRTLFANFGFFMGWFFWIGILLLPIIYVRLRKENASGIASEQQRMLCHFLPLGFLWFAVFIAGFSTDLAFTEVDIRVLDLAYVPAFFLLVMVIAGTQVLMGNRPRAQRYLVVGLALALLFTFTNNTYLFARTYLHHGGLQAALVRAEKDIHASFYGRPAKDVELYLRHPELEKEAVLVDWYGHSADWFSKAEEKLKKHGMIYLYTREGGSDRLARFIEAGYETHLWKRYDFLDAPPLVFKVLKKLKPYLGVETTPEVLVFRVRVARSPVQQSSEKHFPDP